MDSKYLIETNIIAKSIMFGVKSKSLLESIQNVEMTGAYEQGGNTYIVNFLVTANLADMVDTNSREFNHVSKEMVPKNLDDIADDILSNFYAKKDLDAALWSELRKIDSVSNIGFEVSQRDSLESLISLDDLKQRLQNIKFDVVVKVKLSPSSEIKTKIEKAVEKVLKNKML